VPCRIPDDPTLPLLTPDEVARLMAAPSRRSSAGIRDRALLALAARAGLRLSELLDLEPADLRLESYTIYVRQRDGRGSRPIVIDTATRQLLESWLTRRHSLIGDAPAPLLCTYRKGHPPGRLDESQVRRTLRRYRDKAGIENGVHPQALRHTFAATAAQDGYQPERLQLQLGHGHLRTTTAYLDDLRRATRPLLGD
jgi:site-specific recombinase XerD